MKLEDNLMEELLREHARAGNTDDEQFLTEMEEKLNALEKNEGKQKRISFIKRRWAIALSAAACITLLLGLGLHVWSLKRPLYESMATVSVDGHTQGIMTTCLGSHCINKNSIAPSSKKSPPNSQVAKTVVLSCDMHSDTSFGIPVSEIDVILPSQSLDFGFSEDFGASWNSQGSEKLSPSLKTTETNALNGRISEHLAVVERKRKSLNAILKATKTPYWGQSKTEDEESLVEEQKYINARKEYEEAKTKLQQLRLNLTKERIAAKTQNHEKYDELIENKFIAPVDDRSSLSTFAVDVDTASYTNIRRMIRDGEAVPKNAVRIEEMVNYFDYNYAQPTGEHPFAVDVDSAACPWENAHRLVRIGIQGKEMVRNERPPSNLVFLLDVSGSMDSPEKLPLLKKSFLYLLEELNAKDTVSIVVYAGASGLALPPTKVDGKGRQTIQSTLNDLDAGGSTAGGAGITLAYKIATEQFIKDGVNRIILATDGDFNVGISGTEELTKLVKNKAKSGVYASVLGFGRGNLNDAMMEEITNNGNGNYYYIDSEKEGRKVLLEDMLGTLVTIAKDVKVQVQMNPALVKAYRLIGYANRKLPPEAFLDKKADAGEIGAGHQVTALYEIIPADGKPFGKQVDASRYFEKEEKKPMPNIKDSKEMLFVKLAYKKPNQQINDESTYFSIPFTEKEEQNSMDADFKFASAIALSGMILRESEYKGAATLNLALELAKAGKSFDGKGHRQEFLQLIKQLMSEE